MVTVVPVHGTKAFLSVNAVDLTGYLNSANLALAREVAKVQVFSEKFEMAVLGIISGTIKAAMAGDTTIATALWTAFSGDDPVAFEFGPYGTGAPNIKFSGNVGLSNLTFNSGSTGAATIDMDSALSGTVTKGAYA